MPISALTVGDLRAAIENVSDDVFVSCLGAGFVQHLMFKTPTGDLDSEIVEICLTSTDTHEEFFGLMEKIADRAREQMENERRSN